MQKRGVARVGFKLCASAMASDGTAAGHTTGQTKQDQRDHTMGDQE
jgi:hypothetical protein